MARFLIKTMERGDITSLIWSLTTLTNDAVSYFTFEKLALREGECSYMISILWSLDDNSLCQIQWHTILAILNNYL